MSTKDRNKTFTSKYDIHNSFNNKPMRDLSLETSLKRLSQQEENILTTENIIDKLTIFAKGLKILFCF